MVAFNLSNAQEHQTHTEPNTCTIQERVRAVFHSLPYQALPIKLLNYMFPEVTQKLNFIPPKGGISAYYSPREIVTGQRLNYKKECLISFLSYVLAHDEPMPSNSQAPRAIDCLYVGPAVYSTQGGHECYNIATGKIINCHRITIAPVTAAIIAAVEALLI